MPLSWSALPFERWRATCDTLHAHTQVLDKLAAVMAAPEPQLQHAALRLTARGWESAPLPIDEGAAALVVGLDLHAHEAFVEHSSRGTAARIPLVPGVPEPFPDEPLGVGARLAAFCRVIVAAPPDPAPVKAAHLDEPAETPA